MQTYRIDYFCDTCHTQVGDEARSCPKCGQPFIDDVFGEYIVYKNRDSKHQERLDDCGNCNGKGKVYYDPIQEQLEKRQQYEKRLAEERFEATWAMAVVLYIPFTLFSIETMWHYTGAGFFEALKAILYGLVLGAIMPFVVGFATVRLTERSKLQTVQRVLIILAWALFALNLVWGWMSL